MLYKISCRWSIGNFTNLIWIRTTIPMSGLMNLSSSPCWSVPFATNQRATSLGGRLFLLAIYKCTSKYMHMFIYMLPISLDTCKPPDGYGNFQELAVGGVSRVFGVRVKLSVDHSIAWVIGVIWFYCQDHSHSMFFAPFFAGLLGLTSGVLTALSAFWTTLWAISAETAWTRNMQSHAVHNISSLYVPYISVTAKNRGLQAEYVAFWLGHVKLPDSIPIRIGRPDSIRFESDGPIRKFRIAAPATFAVVP